MKHLSWVVVIALVWLNSCSGCKKDNYPVDPITDQRLIQAVNFNNGSYFVYQDSATGEIDSLGVGSFYHYNKKDDDARKYYEIAGYTAASNAYMPSFDFHAGGNIQNVVGAIYKYNPTNYLGLIRVVKLPFIEGVTEEYWSYVKHYTTYQLGNTSYPEVYEVISSGPIYKDQLQGAFHSYYSLDSGLVKFTVLINNQYHTWNLIREKIVR